MEHVPVLLEQVLFWLEPEKKKRILDGTVGLGGHAYHLLNRSGAELLGIDLDQDALHKAKSNLEKFGSRVHLFWGSYVDFDLFMDQLGWDKLDGVLLDLGVSSLQLDRPEKGFSFLREGPLDMRMDCTQGESAYQLVNQASFERLKNILWTYGEEPLAGRIARFIVDARSQRKIETTLDLARIVEKAYPPARRAKSRKHPATKTFQALRLAVNSELDNLRHFLDKILSFLAPKGRIGIISFHSLEDRIVKHFFKERAKACLCPPEVVVCQCDHRPELKILTRKPITAENKEIALNPRSRSAKLRVAERL